MVNIESIKAAEKRIRAYIRRTPVEYSHWLSAQTGADVYVKLENTQVTGSFKVRGALNAVLSARESESFKGVVAASTGNHGAGVAYAARVAECPAIIFVPEFIDEAKLNGIKQRGARVIKQGADCVDSEAAARAYASGHGLDFISPYNDPRVVSGQGTIGLELAHQVDELSVAYIAMGGGGLLSGIGSYLKALTPPPTIVACSPVNSCVMHESLKAGQILDLPSEPTLSDSTAGGVEIGSITFDLCRSVIDQSITVSEDDITNALIGIFTEHKTYIEGAAAVAVAGLLQDEANIDGKTVIVVLCGSNLPLARLQSIMAHGSPGR